MQGEAGGNDVLIAIENLFGSAFNDELYGSESDNVLLGGSGGDLITGRGGIDEANYALALSMVIANLSTHSASGGAGNDVLFGGNGNDTLMGHGGGDEIDGEAGVDTVSYRLAAGNVNVNLGNGTVSGAEGSDTLRNIENILGGDFEDMLIGDAGANRIDGGLGRDELVGAAGNDSVFGGEGNDLLTGDAGNDALIGGPGVNALYGDAGFDVANDSGSLAVAASLVDKVARVGADVAYDTLVDIEGIIGSSASDVLSGLNGLANLLGETFRPGGGNDTVSGGTGVDTVEYAGLRSAYVVARDRVRHRAGAEAVGRHAWHGAHLGRPQRGDGRGRRRQHAAWPHGGGEDHGAGPCHAGQHRARGHAQQRRRSLAGGGRHGGAVCADGGRLS